MGSSSKKRAGASKDPAAGVRNKKRAAMAASAAHAPAPPMQTSTGPMMGHRRAPQPTPPPVYQETIKDSPPSSPGSEKPLKPKMETNRMSSHTAPHMLGNELNPESGACVRLQEQLSAELAAGGAAPPPPALVPPPLLNKAMGSSSARGSSGAQSLDQLLERQWEQGSQFLMEQAQHFDIASLLSCLHQLRSENVRLEEHVGGLLQRRDHLLAVNARLAIPLTLHPMAVSAAPAEASGARGGRENGAPLRPPPPPRPETVTAERHQVTAPLDYHEPGRGERHQMMVREVQQKPS